MRRDYELGFILNPEVSEEQTSAILERIEKIVNNYDGQVVKVNQWGRRRLAYPIERQRDTPVVEQLRMAGAARGASRCSSRARPSRSTRSSAPRSTRTSTATRWRCTSRSPWKRRWRRRC